MTAPPDGAPDVVGEATEAMVEAGAQAIMRSDGISATDLDKYWPREIAHFRAMAAEHGDRYTKGGSVVTNAMRNSRAAIDAAPALSPAPADGGALRDALAEVERLRKAATLTEEQLEARRNHAHAAIVRGLEVRLAAAESLLAEARSVLARVEWCKTRILCSPAPSTSPACPSCGGLSPAAWMQERPWHGFQSDHTPDCAIAALAAVLTPTASGQRPAALSGPLLVAVEALLDHGPATMALARIRGADGRLVEVAVSRASLVGGRLPVGAAIGHRDDGAVLVEMPREPVQGDWRVWVPRGSVVRADGSTEGGDGHGG